MKLKLIIILSILAFFTVGFCVLKPNMHKPFQLNIIEYIIKINADGSVTSTKSTTTTEVKEQ